MMIMKDGKVNLSGLHSLCKDWYGSRQGRNR
jgi:hypothetical protein